MKNINIFSFTAVIAFTALVLSSCSKDDPVIEIDQEEYNAAQIVFIPGQMENGGFVESEDEIVIDFAKDGTPSSHHTHLHAGQAYRMKISLFNNGENINQEIIDDGDEHQFFFLGAPEGVFDYTYEDNQLGLSGILTVKAATESAFEFNIILRHGLNKDHAAAQKWNNPQHVQAGGADDLNFKFEIHVED